MPFGAVGCGIGEVESCRASLEPAAEIRNTKVLGAQTGLDQLHRRFFERINHQRAIGFLEIGRRAILMHGNSGIFKCPSPCRRIPTCAVSAQASLDLVLRVAGGDLNKLERRAFLIIVRKGTDHPQPSFWCVVEQHARSFLRDFAFRVGHHFVLPAFGDRRPLVVEAHAKNRADDAGDHEWQRDAHNAAAGLDHSDDLARSRQLAEAVEQRKQEAIGQKQKQHGGRASAVNIDQRSEHVFRALKIADLVAEVDEQPDHQKRSEADAENAEKAPRDVAVEFATERVKTGADRRQKTQRGKHYRAQQVGGGIGIGKSGEVFLHHASFTRQQPHTEQRTEEGQRRNHHEAGGSGEELAHGLDRRPRCLRRAAAVERVVGIGTCGLSAGKLPDPMGADDCAFGRPSDTGFLRRGA